MNFNLNTINRILQISIFLLVLATVYVRFYKNHHELPKGCDEFGYLHMSEAIDNGNLFSDHTERPFLNDLKQYLSDQGYAKKEYAWIIVPHAYHLDESSDKIINQYPIGTSALLSIFPKAYRQYLFPLVIVLLIYGLTFIVALKEEPKIRKKQFTLTSLFILLSIVIAPFLTEYTNVNSVAPTFGLLIAAGICYSKNWRLAAIFIAITVNFRLANVLLLAPIFLHQFIQFLDSKNLKSFILSAAQAFLILFVFGLLPYSVYTKILLNDFIASTYSSIDQASASLEMAIVNLRYYFLIENKWFIINVVTLSIAYFLNLKKGMKSILPFTISLVLIYLFFLFHAAKTPYYPYGLALILIGLIIHKVAQINTKTEMSYIALNSFIIIGLSVVFLSNYSKFKTIEKLPISAETETLNDCFDNYDVVWGELKTGTIEYATSTPTMRFYWGTQKIRDEIMTWLNKNNYKQAIFLNDLSVNEEELFRLNNKFNITVNNNKIESCGVLLEL